MAMDGRATVFTEDYREYEVTITNQVDYSTSVLEQHLSDVRVDPQSSVAQLELDTAMLITIKNVALSTSDGPIELEEIKEGTLDAGVAAVSAYSAATNLFPDDLEIDGYTFGEARQIWSALLVTTHTLQILSFRWKLGPWEPIKFSKQDWLKHFGKHTGLAERKVSLILDALTYDSTTLKYPDSGLCDPFIRMKSELCVVPPLILQCPIDEWLYRQLMTSNKDQFAAIRNFKEDLQIARLRELLPMHIEFHRGFNVTLNRNITTDLDPAFSRQVCKVRPRMPIEISCYAALD